MTTEHKSYEAQQAFMGLPPEQRDLKIWMYVAETNGNTSEALRRIGKVEGIIVGHDSRLTGLERWQLRAMAIIGAAIAFGPAFFFLLDRWITN